MGKDNSTTITADNNKESKKKTKNEVKKESTSNETTTSREKKEFEYEFFGPIGALGTTLMLPIVILLLLYWSDVGSVTFDFLDGGTTWKNIFNKLICPSCSQKSNTLDVLCNCTCVIIGWFGFQALLERFLPCELVQGAPIKGNEKENGRLWYRINGHLAFWITLLITQVGWPVWNNNSGTSQQQLLQLTSAPIELLYDYYAELSFVTIVLCFLMSIYLYISSFFGGKNKILADGGISGNVVYDFFIGRELNPRIWNNTFDLKEFCELRPGLIGWMILNASCMIQQHRNLGYVSGSMMLINIFQGIYVWDALYQERAILTTMDITQDGFGFMLCFGDLAWVPFTYSLQAKYLVKHDPNLSYITLFCIILLHIVGYSIFRGANGQKDAFRRNPSDPSVAHLSFLQTKRGTKLLVSGYWGMARKINYTGDWLMGLSWCMVCGFDSIVPYFYAIYFAILLIHRSERDDAMCHNKYGDDWLTYKQMVPYRFIPG
eukprot:CAMPEP_0194168426 /NCGR_PEP_ID=MMETSP0154-20130528/3403_1 /TAXON_ID=1049557 /ORGANISM="Thalassiothrix antarctica, Strain L6-D1" /LENGTH=489 /DNA_ID=CAMNT_0038879571 /DNA_START=26 /DNA_END=1491 /DNA_ORIENTATION=-